MYYEDGDTKLEDGKPITADEEMTSYIVLRKRKKNRLVSAQIPIVIRLPA